MLTVGDDGQPAETVERIEIDGLSIQANTSKGVNRVVVFVENLNELIILSPKTYRSTFAKRFILDQFDSTAYRNPLFAESANPRNSPFFLKADGVQILDGGSKIILRAGGGYQVEADLRTNLAKMPNVKDPLPFAFHRRLHDKQTGKMAKIASAGSKGQQISYRSDQPSSLYRTANSCCFGRFSILIRHRAKLWPRAERSEQVHAKGYGASI